MMTASHILKNERFGPVEICWPEKKKLFDYLPKNFHSAVISSYMRIFKEKNYREANLKIYELNQSIVKKDCLRAGQFNLMADDADLCDWAKVRAVAVEMAKATKGYEGADARALAMCDEHGIEPLKTLINELGQDANLLERVARYQDDKWWRRRMRRKKAQVIDQLARRLNMVHQRNQIYLSDEALSIRRSLKRKNRKMLENMQAENQHGDVYTLAELADLSTSNPENRRHELMVRMKGFEWVADNSGHIGEFITLTCPSKYHPSSGNRPNPKYEGYTPKEANDYLTYKVWAGVRRDLDKQGLQVYGFRVVEPHHDGCPHWHLMLFMRQEDRAKIKSIITKHAMAENPEEKGAAVHRCKFVRIDPSKGSAAGYIAKYVAKNIDGEGVENDLYGKDAKTSAQRITEWAGTWSIRQFQQVGGPSVTVWRELRRLTEKGLDDWDEVLEAIGDEKTPRAIRWARMAADVSNWGVYVMLQGGALVSFRDRPIQLLKMAVPLGEGDLKVNPITGEEITEKTGVYGDLVKKVKGLVSGGCLVISRSFRWVVRPIEKVLGVGGLSGSLEPPWTCVNNCPSY